MKISKIKQKEIELKKKIILEEAKKIINKVGFKSTKMSEIAKKVGFSKASLYSYFNHKEDIAMSLFKVHLEKMYEKIKILPGEDITALEKFNRIRNIHLNSLAEGKHLMMIKPHFNEINGVHHEVFTLKDKIFETVKEIIYQGIDEGSFNSSINVDQVIILLDSLMSGIVFQFSMLKNVKSDLVNSMDIEILIKEGLDLFLMAITNKKTELSK